MDHARANFVADMSWDAVSARLAGGCAALLAIGAGAKEHGLHLPMNTDEIQADWLAGELARHTDMLIWPTLRYGHYPAFRDFPGSVSLPYPLFANIVRAILRDIARWKPRAIFILDTGISTLAPVKDAIAAEEWNLPVVHLPIHQGPRYRAAAERLQEQAFGSHADELETSRMLVIAPDKVDLQKARKTPSGPFDGALSRSNAPSGSYGDPELATAAKGHEVIAAMLADLSEVLDANLHVHR